MGSRYQPLECCKSILFILMAFLLNRLFHQWTISYSSIIWWTKHSSISEHELQLHQEIIQLTWELQLPTTQGQGTRKEWGVHRCQELRQVVHRLVLEYHLAKFLLINIISYNKEELLPNHQMPICIHRDSSSINTTRTHSRPTTIHLRVKQRQGCPLRVEWTRHHKTRFIS